MKTHKEITKHIRGRLKAHKVPARVKMNDFCGKTVVTIVTPTYDFRWTPEQLREIGICAQVNKLTRAQGMPIDLDVLVQLTGLNQINFEFHAA
jgi:hypothetical protein